MLTLPQQFFLTAERAGSKCALRHKQGGSYQDLTFAETAEAVRKVARAWMGLGAQAGDRIAILSENRPEWVMADLGAMLAGAITVPIHTTFSGRQISDVLDDSGSRFLIISSPELLRKFTAARPQSGALEAVILIEAAPAETLNSCQVLSWSEFLNRGREDAPLPAIQPEDLCTLIYTSGTTGRPKGVMLTHAHLLSNAAAALEAVPITQQDTLLSILPLSHVYERTGGYVAALILGGATIAYAKSLKELAENLLEVRPTIFIAVPRLFDQMHDRIQSEIGKRGPSVRRFFHWGLRQKPNSLAYRLADKVIFRRIRKRWGGCLRLAISGGSGLDPKRAIFFQRMGLPICEGYGMTETSPIVSVNRPNSIKIGTVGKPLTGVQVQIAPDGEILVKGPGVARGYWQDDEATKALFNGSGWLHTGDLGSWDDQGFLRITGRKKEMLVTAAGKNVWPEPLEARLNASDYIAQSMVVGDQQKYVGALIVPDFNALRTFWEGSNRDRDAGILDLQNPQIVSLFRREVDRATAEVAEYEKITRFVILSRSFTQEHEELTLTLKLRRHIIAAHFQEEIARIFRS